MKGNVLEYPFATGKDNRNVWIVLPSFLLQQRLFNILFLPHLTLPLFFFFFFAFYVLHSYFLTVKHCVGSFF